MTPILIRAELTAETMHRDFVMVQINGVSSVVPRALIVTPDDPVTPAMVDARYEDAPVSRQIAGKDAAAFTQEDWSAMMRALLDTTHD